MSIKLWKVLLAGLIILIVIIALKISSPFGTLFYVYLNLMGLVLIYLLTYASLRIAQKQNMKRYFSIPIGLLVLLVFSIQIITLVDYRLLIPDSRLSHLSPTEWQEDFTFVDVESAKHPKTDSALSESICKIKMLNSNTNENLVKLMQKVALFRDGHTMIHPFQFHSDSRYFPLRGYYFTDGYFITDAADEYIELKYAKMIRINSIDFDSVFNRIKSVIGADNLSQYKSMLDVYLFSATVLNGLKLIEDDQKAVFHFETETGEKISKEIDSEPFIAWLFWAAKPLEHFSPVYFNRRTKNYTLNTIGNDLVLALNLIENQSDDYTIKDLRDDIEKEIRQSNFQRLIIDLRANSGGNNYLYKPIIELIKANQSINQKSKLFTLISRRTFSAGVNFVDELQAETNITLVGESPGAGATHFGDARYLNLPNTKFGLLISTKQWFAKDSLNGNWDIKPDIVVNYSIQHFKKNHDPWFDQIK